jgi:phenylalanyl-tRNA synthetase beta chain
MLIPLSWLREHADLPADASGRDVAEHLIAAGLEVEGVEVLGVDVVGPLVVGRIESITARTTYGYVSDGMICSARELGIGDDHAGILVLGPGRTVGQDLEPELDLHDEVLDVSITPDRGYCMSVRGLARELATAYDVPFHDPADRIIHIEPGSSGPVVELDSAGCHRFVALELVGLDPGAPSLLWMRARLHRSGIRPISLAVDVTNYVQVELGQPLHAYDAGALVGAIVVRDALDGERATTLDGTERALVAGDVVITDAGSGDRASRIIGVAGVMGGASTEISSETTGVVLEAAHLDAVAVSRTGRRLGLASEAARRFERGVDPKVAIHAAERAAELLVEHGGARVTGTTDVGTPTLPGPIRMAAGHPGRVAGMSYGSDVVAKRLRDVGCEVTSADGGDELVVEPPSWRPDLEQPNDLAEEVIRLEGYQNLPSILPQAPAGRGLTEVQRVRRRMGRALAAAGYVEVLPSPFIGTDVLDGLGIDEEDERRRLVRLANPLSDEEPFLRPLLLADLLPTLRRNIGRGTPDVALFELGKVFVERPGERPAPGQVPRPSVAQRPSEDELAELDATLPLQPEHVAVVLAGSRQPTGWWGSPTPASWADAVEAARVVAGAAGASVTARAADQAPWHPGRCAAIELDGVVIGWAGELHPRVTAALDVPPRTSAMELDLEPLLRGLGTPVRAPTVSTYPPAKEDLALVVESDVPVADVEAAVRAGAGELLEDLRLFDVYTGDQVTPGHKSLAFHLRLRAPDRTLTAEEAATVREGALREAAARTGARLRT